MTQKLSDTFFIFKKANNPHGNAAHDPKFATEKDLSEHEDNKDVHKGQKKSIELDDGNLQLKGDVDSPGSNRVYGTDSQGNKGWKTDPANGAGIEEAPIDGKPYARQDADWTEISDLEVEGMWEEKDSTTIKPIDNKDIEVNNLNVKKQATFEGEYDNGDSGTEITIDWRNGNRQRLRLTDDCTINFIAPLGIGNLILKVIQDGAGHKEVTNWDIYVRWAEGTKPKMAAGGAARHLVSFYYDGEIYYGQTGRNYS